MYLYAIPFVLSSGPDENQEVEKEYDTDSDKHGVVVQ